MAFLNSKSPIIFKPSLDAKSKFFSLKLFNVPFNLVVNTSTSSPLSSLYNFFTSFIETLLFLKSAVIFTLSMNSDKSSRLNLKTTSAFKIEFLVCKVVFSNRILVLEYVKSVVKFITSTPLLSTKYKSFICVIKFGPIISRS